MKTHSLLISFLMLLVIMGACSSGPVMRNATGFAYEIVVTMDKADWDAPAGKAIKAELTSDIPGLPQAEPAFKITYVTPDQFNGLLTYVRNVLIVRIDKSQYTKVSLNYENNRWAKGQVVMTLTAPDDAAILEYVKAHPRNIVEFFTKCERNRTGWFGSECKCVISLFDFRNSLAKSCRHRFSNLVRSPSGPLLYNEKLSQLISTAIVFPFLDFAKSIVMLCLIITYLFQTFP